MTDPLDPSATHGLDLHDAHHVSMDKFDLGHLNGLGDVDDHFPDFDNDEASAVPDVKPDMSPHHSNMDMNMNGGGMIPQMMPPPASASTAASLPASGSSPPTPTPASRISAMKQMLA